MFLPGSELARQHGQIFHTWASYGNMAPYVFRMRSGYHCVEDDCENLAGVDIFHSSGPYPWTKWYGCPMPTGCLKDGTGIYSIKIGTTVPHLKSSRGGGGLTAIPPAAVIGDGDELYSWNDVGSATAGQQALAKEGLGPLGFIAKSSGVNDYEHDKLFLKSFRQRNLIKTQDGAGGLSTLVKNQDGGGLGVRST